jgi:FMN phosphatase YigB (HAD superfamily)
MHTYLGFADKEIQTLFARQTYAMILLAEITSDDLVRDFVEYLRTIRERYTLALITTTPEESVLPILRKLHCEDLFEIIFASAPNNHPDKHSLFADFLTKYENPLFYIGLGDTYLGGLKELDINTISVNWVSEGAFRGDYEVDTVEELQKIL